MPSKGGLQEHFLHWTQEGSHLVFNDDDTIWVLDLESGDLRQVADVDLNYERLVDPPRSSIRFMYGFHADVSPDGSHIVYSTCEYPDDRLIETWKGTGNTEPHYEGLEAYELGTVDIKGNGRKRLTQAAGLGPVHTKGSGHVIIHVWNSHKLTTNSSNRTYPCSVAM